MAAYQSDSAGSSPRMWGTLDANLHGYAFERFIPTHVGNTKMTVAWCCALTVHPHACGEHLSGDGMIVTRSGSSPRMWGTRLSTLPGVGE